MTGDGHLIKLGLKSAILAACLLIPTAGKCPPAQAQQQLPASAEDATQDANIQAINEHLRNTDKNVSDLQNKIDLNALAVAGMEGEEKIMDSVLALLITLTGGASVSSLVIQVKMRRNGHHHTP